MKKIKFLSGIFLALIFLISSCSKEDASLPVKKDKAYLSFHTSLHDLAPKQLTKQNGNNSGCAVGTPTFIEIILTQQDVYLAGSETAPLRLNINPAASDDQNETPIFFTEDSATMELVPGTYTLEYFTVLDAEQNVLWIAPMNDHQKGGIDDMVEHSLPMAINLEAGVVKSQDVEVLCFDDRIVNEYGYIFYDLNGYQINEFCIFGNYCDGTGRHAEFILYEVDVWEYSGNAYTPKGKLLHENLRNEVVITDYEDYSETNSFPLCFTLADGPGLDEYFIEISQINVGSENVLIRSGLISDADVRGLFKEDGTMDYYHFREGNCNLRDEPLLLSNPQDLINYTWEFTFSHDDAMTAADVNFYADGTASYQLYGDPQNIIWGTWTYFDDSLFYDLDGNEEILDYMVSGKFTEENFSGFYWHNGIRDTWFASLKF